MALCGTYLSTDCLTTTSTLKKIDFFVKQEHGQTEILLARIWKRFKEHIACIRASVSEGICLQIVRPKLFSSIGAKITIMKKTLLLTS